MKENSNLFGAVLVILVFMFLWNKFVVSKYLPKPGTTTSTSQAANSPSATSTLTKDLPLGNKQLPPASQTPVTLLTDQNLLIIDPRGAGVMSWHLKEGQHWLEMVHDAQSPEVLPLSTFPELTFSVQSRTEARLVMAADHPSGFRITKTISLMDQPPFHKVSLTFTNLSGQSVELNAELPWRGLGKTITEGKSLIKEDRPVLPEMKALAFGKATDPKGQVPLDKMRERLVTWRTSTFHRTIDEKSTGEFDWAGVDNNHFLAAFIPVEGKITELYATGDRRSEPRLAIPMHATLKPGESISHDFLLYVGPKESDQLKAAGHNLDKSITFGMFGPIAAVLFKGLKFFNSKIHNWGWSIILFTLCLQLLLFPLTRNTLRHSVRMRELQPQLKKLQEQYKTDPKRMQIETFNLYKRNGMSFMGLEGCIPMLLQFPILLAIYAVLNNAYDLRGAPWIFWIHDLAGKDPRYVLPIFMGLLMFAQQKLTSVATDPAQARMMMFMPILFTWIFLRMPAGLVLYYTVYNLCSIGIQQILKMQTDANKSLTPAT